MKRLLFLTHRWLGLTLGVLVTLWFASAFVMMYVGFPSLTAVERCAGLAALPSSSWRVSAAQASAAVGSSQPPSSARLGEVLGRPVYHLRPADGGPWVTVRADDGQPLPTVAPETAVAIARRFAAGTYATARHDGLRDHDQWTVSSSLDPFRPLHRVALGDADGTEFYVSARTGEVLRDTRHRERMLNYAGAVTHWVYPTWLRRHNVTWRVTLRILAGAAMMLPLTGLVLGLRRARVAWRPFRGARRWHVLTGAAFGVFAVTWLFSGFLSLRFTGIFDDGEPTRAQTEALAGGALDLAAFTRAPGDAFAAIADLRLKEGRLVQVAGQPFYLVRAAPDQTRLLPAGGSGPVLDTFAPGLLRERAAALLPGHRLVAFEELTAYDAHYYSRRPGEDPRPLPAWRIRFDDADATWFHLDPRTGQLTERLTRGARAYRWLFNGLHSFDWPWLAARRPLWDIVVITLLLGGLATTLFGLRLSWRRTSLVGPTDRPPDRVVGSSDSPVPQHQP